MLNEMLPDCLLESPEPCKWFQFCLFVYTMILCKMLFGFKRSGGGCHYFKSLEIANPILAPRTSPRLRNRHDLLKGKAFAAGARELCLFLLRLEGTSVYSPFSPLHRLAQNLESDVVWVLAPAFIALHAWRLGSENSRVSVSSPGK